MEEQRRTVEELDSRQTVLPQLPALVDLSEVGSEERSFLFPLQGHVLNPGVDEGLRGPIDDGGDDELGEVVSERGRPNERRGRRRRE